MLTAWRLPLLSPLLHRQSKHTMECCIRKGRHRTKPPSPPAAPLHVFKDAHESDMYDLAVSLARYLLCQRSVSPHISCRIA